MAAIFSFFKDRKRKKSGKCQKSERTKIIEALDRLFSIFIRKRDKVCLACRFPHPDAHLSCHHIISRRHLSTRFTPKNGVTLCVSHHRQAHGDPEWFRDWVLRKIMTPDEYETLKRQAFSRSGFSTADLKLFLAAIRKGSATF